MLTEGQNYGTVAYEHVEGIIECITDLFYRRS